MVNGLLTDEGRRRLDASADEVLVRENAGFDIWAHKAALTHMGERIAEFDELVLTNDTWFGPVRPFGPVISDMDARGVDFWGLTDHPSVPQESSWTGAPIPYHLQSFWIAVRRRMFLSSQWAAYWRDLPVIASWTDAVIKHEVEFTAHFAREGFTHAAAFGHERYDSENPSVFNADEMLEDGSPVIKRKALFFWPPSMDHYAAVGRWTLANAERFGYPRELMLPNLAKNSPPRDLSTDLGMLEILSDVDESYDVDRPLRILVIAHVFYVDMAQELLERSDFVPGPYRLVVTTPDADRAERIEQIIAAHPRPGREAEVRVLPSNDGRDQSAFLIACRDLLLGDEFDVVVKVHSKKTPQQGYAVGQHFKEQQLDNILPNAGYVANLLALFQKEKGIGLAYPPMIHIGHGTLGHAWWGNRPRFEVVARQLGIRIPIDGVSPLAPYGSMYVARPAALRLLVEHPWRYAEFGGSDAYKDGGLAHVLERMPSYVAAERGFHTRTVLSAEYAALSHTSLEFKMDEMSATIPGSPREKIALLHRAGWMGTGRAADFFWMYVRYNHPGRVARLERMRDLITSPRLLARRAKGALRGGWRRG
ncbi:rhamnan synthesis F family protein [uncultured Microbacterium sp.]|uniref:rhamnan synthesis F family protein n=1 Tax=uncultured Microbacterium sp. TaxID=191216 RepID=UPI0035C9B440